MDRALNEPFQTGHITPDSQIGQEMRIIDNVVVGVVCARLARALNHPDTAPHAFAQPVASVQRVHEIRSPRIIRGDQKASQVQFGQLLVRRVLHQKLPQVR